MVPHRTQEEVDMAGKRIRVGFCQIISLDHLVGEKTFESVKPVVEVEDEPREGEDEHDAYRRIRDEAELLFTKEVNAQLSLALKIRKGLKT
jgi:hypothetical protein